MKYDHKEIEKKWTKFWKNNDSFKAYNKSDKPKFYILDMFPYPSGAGLHVGHPLGYIASDIYTRFKRLMGFNVLHPMGFDAFGLPAEQYAIQTGQHPAKTTEENIKRYREQLEKIGLSFDPTREFKTCDPNYFKWTQDVFIKLFHAWYDQKEEKAKNIDLLIKEFEKNGNTTVSAANNSKISFSSLDWKNFSEEEKATHLLDYRLAYLANTYVNWCPKLGTVLANDEVRDGLSVRGGHPVQQKKMRQWSLRISAYADRLLRNLEKLEWSDALKDMQKNWIGKSLGAEVNFKIKNTNDSMEVFTTRPDTIYGVTFMVLAPESSLLENLLPDSHKEEVQNYIDKALRKTERERMQENKTMTGVFTGTYCLHPLTQEELPIYVSDYVLSGYGTGAIMAVPAHDSRDYDFAKKFDLPIIPVVSGGDIEKSSYDAKEGKIINSDFLNGLDVKKAIKKVISEMEEQNLGKAKTNYRLRDAIFSRQRYWGEPFPVYFKDNLPHTIPFEDLPLGLPEVDQYLPTEEGHPPLARAKDWTYNGHPIEYSTMPGFAGSSAYFLRHMDPQNEKELVSQEANQYWRNVDFYVGGSEHATGHLLYSRFWNMFLYDFGLICEEEPFKKLVNQGMIQGRSNFVYRINGTKKFVSAGLKGQHKVTPIHVDVNIVKNDILDTEKFKNWREEYKDAEFILENGEYICGNAIEKMSKSFYNVVNPDDIIEKEGADTFRLYEMFLGPIEKSKPWNTQGMEGISRFLNKFWSLYFNDNKNLLTDEKATEEELKILHKTIKKVREDMEILSFNTAISAMMICVNELGQKNCHKKEILSPLVILIAPFAPFLSEELWEKALKGKPGIQNQTYPKFDEKYLVESSYSLPVAFNGKTRFLLEIPMGTSKEKIEELARKDEKSGKWLEGKTIVKTIIVPNKMINFVIK